MTQPVLRPARQSSFFTNHVEFVSRIRWNDPPDHVPVRAKPHCKIRLNLYNSSPRSFRLAGFDFDESTNRVNLAPFKAFDFRIAESGEGPDCQHRKYIREQPVCSVQKRAKFVNAEDFRRVVWQFWSG